MTRLFYLFIAHGSREAQSNTSLFELVRKFQEKYQLPNVRGAFLEIAAPLIPEGIDQCVQEGATEIYLVPLMLFQGRHVARDIPQILSDAQDKHPNVKIHYLGAFADPHSIDGLMEFLKGKIESFQKK